MKLTFLRLSSVTAAALSTTWVISLAALVMRCKLSDEPFPVLAKFSPFHQHLAITDRLLTLSPVFVLSALGLVTAVWYRERSFRAVGPVAIVCAALVSLSLLTMIANPGGWLSWFLSKGWGDGNVQFVV